MIDSVELRNPVTQLVQQILKIISIFLRVCQAFNHENFLYISAAHVKERRNLFPLWSQSRVGRFWHSADGHTGSELRNLIILQAVQEGRANKGESERLNPVRDDSAPTRWCRPSNNDPDCLVTREDTDQLACFYIYLVV